MSRRNTMKRKPGLDRWLAFAESVLGVGERIFAEGEIPMTDAGAADHRVIAVLLLIRTMSHMRAIIALARAKLIVESRMLARSCFENLFYVAALREKGDKFVLEMKHDEVASRHARGQFIMQLQNRQKDADRDAKLLGMLKQWAKEKRKFLSAKETALAGATANSYIYYSQLSADAGHPTFSSLNRYLVSDVMHEDSIRGIDFNPIPEEHEMADTLSWACEAAISVCVGVNEMLGHTPASPDLVKLADEYAALEEIATS
jgi:hypothetical protein